ncbi:putative membrane protein clustering with ActP [Paramagnetospirillum magnetotacticum MS-1]|uniref:Putative membrane protein clustering with ActP n=1 Tax=Paramagnetospirillum magnetotacticum MS-1 TaxID=272627 RepID=A0A0C2YWJ3_PARME|nr:DUF485 domain-containing protein [Paramagnetospirillum magnetotacticum]KIL99065.1 putative membrane protein clustering with ActP [Paramagnetospirillum magnetotacticum MS-1]
MSDSDTYARVRQNPKFHELVKKRTRLAVTLSVIVLGSYYCFMMIVAFAPEILRTPLSEGSNLTVGVPVGAAIIVVSWLLTGLYSHFANGEFEELNKDVVREVLE